MKWSEIRKQHPDKFILIGGFIEEKISGTQSKIIEGKILKISDDGKEIRKVYQQYKQKGMNVLYSLPTTPEEFIVENVPFTCYDSAVIWDRGRHSRSHCSKG